LDEKDIERRLAALEALEEQLQRRVGDLDVLVEGFHARIDAILARMTEAADRVSTLAETLEGVGHAVRGPTKTN
jgi:hypothetical protein